MCTCVHVHVYDDFFKIKKSVNYIGFACQRNTNMYLADSL